MGMLNLTGKRFGRLVVLKPIEKRTNSRNIIWHCVCDCGKEVFVASCCLKRGDTKSCGCLNIELIKKRNTTHNMSHTSIYNTWIKMHRRCENLKDLAYKNYGGRGIKVCEWWHKFENFFEDMGLRPQGLTLERLDNDGNYEPGNCKWATRKEQNNNKRDGKNQYWFRAWYKDMVCQFVNNNQSIFARRYGLRKECIHRCLNKRQKTHKGWTFERIY